MVSHVINLHLCNLIRSRKHKICCMGQFWDRCLNLSTFLDFLLLILHGTVGLTQLITNSVLSDEENTTKSTHSIVIKIKYKMKNMLK